MHNIYQDNQTGKHSFFSVKEKAWHGVGHILEGHPTSSDAMRLAGLDFTVEKRPLFTYDTQNQNANPDTDIIIPEIDVPDYYATVRTDKDIPLGVVGNKYEILQNTEAFSFFDEFASKYNIAYETAGALGNGERIFITATVPGSIRVGKDDEIKKYLLFTNHHGGLGSITVAITPVRVVCQNTLNAALKHFEHVKRFRHSKGAAEKLHNAEAVIKMLDSTFPAIEQTFNHLAKVRITDAHVRRLIELAMCPSSEVLHMIQHDRDSLSTRFTNTIDAVVKYSQEHDTQLTIDAKGTLWGTYNSITGYYQNAKDYKNNEQKADSILYDGSAMRHGQRALDLCLDYASSGSEILFN